MLRKNRRAESLANGQVRAKIRILIWFVISACLLFCLLAATGCGKETASRNGSATLVLAAYTTPREAYNRAIIPAFQKYWKEKTGQDVEFRESYQGSGAQSRAIISGFEADIAALSLEADLDRIEQAGLIRHDWRANQNKGIVSTSIVVAAVRSGNPAGIKDWQDLTRPGLKVLMPDPKTSGGAQWNVVAIYGAALRGYTDVAKQNPEAAKDFLKRLLSNVSIMDKGARESITNFEKGVGDVAITYENEVLVGRQAGHQYDYVVPRSTVLIENPVALVDAYVDKHGVREVARAFVDFLFTSEVQSIYAKYGLRPVRPETSQQTPAQFPAVEDLWRIGFLGGWKQVTPDLFSATGIYTRSFEELHASP